MRILPFLLLLAATLPLPAQTKAPAKASPKSTEAAATPLPVRKPLPPKIAEPATPAIVQDLESGATTVTPPPPKTGDACLDLATSFFEYLKKDLIDEAYTNLTRGSKIGDRPEELRGLKTKTTEAVQLFGKIRGFEVIESKTVGSTLRRYTIVSFGRDFPLRWRFYFYKSDEQWRLVDLHVDDRLNSIFDEQEEATAADAKPQ